MPSLRRAKIASVLIFVLIVSLLFFTGSLRQQRREDHDFYEKTVHALARKGSDDPGSGDDSQWSVESLHERLAGAAKLAKDNANAKAPRPDPPSAVVGKGSSAEGGGAAEKSIAGRKKFGSAEGNGDGQRVLENESAEDHAIEVELNTILKKSPIIIFSKTYCPHSKRAKDILLSKYDIDPAPHVVELDTHPIGAQLQSRLAKLTNRKTVPNILVNGVSIGGGDEIVDLDLQQDLISKVKDLGGKKITAIMLKETVLHGLR